MAGHRVLALGFIACLVTACGMPALMPSSSELVFPPDTFKVLTYNALHGLEVGRFWVTRGESKTEHAARFTLRIQQTAEAQPDLIFLRRDDALAFGDRAGYARPACAHGGACRAPLEAV